MRTVIPHAGAVSKTQRRALNGHGSFAVWLTGLSAAGKSTIANALDAEFHRLGLRSALLDGDNVRLGLCRDLGFTDTDRHENVRRVGEAAKLLVEAGVIAITALISPFARDRQAVRERFEADEFVEIHVRCPIDECERRDPKGLYRKARAGELKHFTGVDSPYEIPTRPELILETDRLSASESVASVLAHLRGRGLVR